MERTARLLYQSESVRARHSIATKDPYVREQLTTPTCDCIVCPQLIVVDFMDMAGFD